MRLAVRVLVTACLAVTACDDKPATPVAASTPSTTAAAAPSAPAPPVVITPPPSTPTPPPTAVAAQHVLVAYKGAQQAPAGVTRSKAEARKRAEEVRDKAKAGGDFSALVAAYSDDAGAKERLGSVGKFSRER